MKFAVESWAPEYGVPVGDVEDHAAAEVDTDIERPLADWAPIDPSGEPFPTVAFVDGIRRVDARVWVDDSVGPGLCASWAAGVVTCGASAEVTEVQVERGLFVPVAGDGGIDTAHGSYRRCAVKGDQPEDLVASLQRQMRELEAVVAVRTDADLVVLDGPLVDRRALANAVGFIKTHHAMYGPEEVQATVARLDDGQRTPVFSTKGSWDRHTWYLRLPGPRSHPWSGIVRLEAGGGLDDAAVIDLAGRSAATLPRFASSAYREPRAPQNLTPIAGLEQYLRHRLGDRDLLERALRHAAG